MKHFIKRILLFTIISSFIFITIGHFYKVYFLGIVNSDWAFCLPLNISTVFLGDSHALTSFDPTIINDSFNGSIDSETLFHTFYKMKALLKNNPQIKNVVLTYSFHNLSLAENENVLYSDKYYFFFDEKAKEIIQSAGNGKLLKFKYSFDNYYTVNLFTNFEHFINSNLLWLKYDIGFPIDADKYMNFFISVLKKKPQLTEHPLFPGTYKSYNSNLKLRVVDEAIKRHYYFKSESGSSKIMIEYLFKMAELCHNNKIKFILINTPLHSSYKSKIPEYYIKLHSFILDDLKNKFDNVYYYNFTTVNYPDSLFGDGDHLNAFGMERFSEEIKNLLSM